MRGQTFEWKKNIVEAISSFAYYAIFKAYVYGIGWTLTTIQDMAVTQETLDKIRSQERLSE